MLRFIKWNFGLRYQMYMSQETIRLKNITLFEMLCIMKFRNFAPRCLWQVWTITLYYILHACLKSHKEEQRWSAILYLIPQYHTECQAVECFKQFLCISFTIYTGAAFGPLMVGWLTDQYVSCLYSGTPLNGHPWIVGTHNITNNSESPDCHSIHFNT